MFKEIAERVRKCQINILIFNLLYKLFLVVACFDFYGQPVTLNYRNEDSYKTFVGGIFSIIINAVFIWVFYDSIIAFFTKTKVSTTGYLSFEENPSLVQMNPQQFMLAISLEQEDFLTNPYFDVIAEQRFYHRSQSGERNKYSEILDLIPCSIQAFQPIFKDYDQNFTSTFESKNLKNYLCLNSTQIEEKNIKIGGNYFSEHFQFLKISVKECQNKTYPPDYSGLQKVCKTKQQINEYLKENQYFTLKFLATNYIINAQNTEDIVSIYLSEDLFFNFVSNIIIINIIQISQFPNQMTKMADVYVKNEDIYTDQSIIQKEFLSKESVILRSEGDMREQFILTEDSNSNPCNIYFRKSSFTQTTKRYYLKVDDLLSYLGGFIQILIAFFGIFVNFYNKSQCLKLIFTLLIFLEIISIANDMFDFQSTYEEDYRSRSKASFSGEQNELDAENAKITREKGFRKFKDVFILRKKIFVNFRYLINQIFFGVWGNTDCHLLEKATTKIEKDLDVCQILERLNEIEKLKLVLFNTEQLNMFNFTPKPKIQVEKEKDISKLSQKMFTRQVCITDKDKHLWLQYNQLLEAYQKLHQLQIKSQNDLTVQDAEQKRFNDRLLQLLGRRIRKLLSSIQTQSPMIQMPKNIMVIPSPFESALMNKSPDMNGELDQNKDEFQDNSYR